MPLNKQTDELNTDVKCIQTAIFQQIQTV